MRMMRRALPWLLAFALFSAAPIFPADSGDWWRWSLVTMAAANTADTVTSLRAEGRPGIREANSLYGEHFTARDAGVKSAFVGGQAITQWLLVRRWPRLARWFALVNFGQSIGPAWAAQHNGRLR